MINLIAEYQLRISEAREVKTRTFYYEMDITMQGDLDFRIRKRFNPDVETAVECAENMFAWYLRRRDFSNVGNLFYREVLEECAIDSFRGFLVKGPYNLKFDGKGYVHPSGTRGHIELRLIKRDQELKLVDKIMSTLSNLSFRRAHSM
ncbi:hypothetical protein J4216_04975 [Candidatus Woesearchaeota archaeon]|nr:hypothetical protein [Candidatus Woesearchaeota archaeon]